MIAGAVVYELLLAHLLSDKGIPENVKSVSQLVFIVVGALYILFGLVF